MNWLHVSDFTYTLLVFDPILLTMNSSTTSITEKIFKSTLVVGSLLLIGFIIYQAHHVVLMTLLGVGLASLVSPILTQVRERFKIPRALTALIFLIVLFLLGALVTFAAGFLVADQLQNLSERFPNIIKNLEKQWTELSSEYTWAQSWLKDFDIIGTVREGILRLFKGVQSGMQLFTGIGFAIVIALYTSVGSKTYLKSFVSAFPKSKREKVKETLSLCSQNLRKWFVA